MFDGKSEGKYLKAALMPIEKEKCLRCGYSWYPRKPGKPKYCANKKCRSPYWNKSKIRISGPKGNI